MTQFESVLKAERDRLAKKIEAIDALLSNEFPGRAARRAKKAATKSAPARKGHKMSAAVREKIRQTQQARWAKLRAGKKA